MYCSREHQVSHRPQHKAACNEIKKAKAAVVIAESELRATPGDEFGPPGAVMFEEHVGHFWGYLATRPYMQARYAVVQALLKVNNRYAVEESLDHLMGLLNLCHGDNMGVRAHVPALMLRLGKDQECYDFLKWYATVGQESTYRWGDEPERFLHLKNEDVFEDPKIFYRKWADLGHITAVTLIKMRLLLDVKALQSSSAIGTKVPQEILDNIRSQSVSSIIAGNKEIMASKNQSILIEKLQKQVKTIYDIVKMNNKHFWPTIVNPGKHLGAPQSIYSHGTVQEMELILNYSYAAFAETPGVLKLVRELLEKDRA